MCVAHSLYVLSSLLVNKLTDCSDKSSNQPMAYERCKSKNIKKICFSTPLLRSKLTSYIPTIILMPQPSQVKNIKKLIGCTIESLQLYQPFSATYTQHYMLLNPRSKNIKKICVSIPLLRNKLTSYIPTIMLMLSTCSRKKH